MPPIQESVEISFTSRPTGVTPPARIAVLASGGGSNLQAIIDHFSAPERRKVALVSAVLSNREGAGALDRARAAGIPAAVVRTDDDGTMLLEALDAYRVDLIVLAGYLKLIPRRVLLRFPERIVNIHPGPLPRFGGAGMYGKRVHEAVLAAGVQETEVTVHLVDEEYDRGSTIVRWRVPVVAGDTVDSLARRVLEVEHAVFPLAIEMIARMITLNDSP
jgi:phosphoribosylglycinamide formyltransferase 1